MPSQFRTEVAPRNAGDVSLQQVTATGLGEVSPPNQITITLGTTIVREYPRIPQGNTYRYYLGNRITGIATGPLTTHCS